VAEILMPTLSVHVNRNLRSRDFFPLLVDVQSELLRDLETRVVIPLVRAPSLTSFPLRYVMPTVQLEGKTYVLMTPQLTGLSRTALGPCTGSLAAHARDISTATDMLFRGFASG
jgi:toxin CcdB